MTVNRSSSLLSGFSKTLLAAATLGVVVHADASPNLLVNGDFNNGLTGWDTWTAGGWVNAEIPAKLAGTSLNPPTWPSAWPEGAGTNYDANPSTPLYDGSLQLTVGQGGAGSGSYCNQTVAAAENVEYTLTVQGGADSWWLPYGEARMFFLDAADSVLSSSIVRTSDSIHNEFNGGLGDLYDVGVSYQNWTNVATSPIGTKKIKVELANPVGNGSTWFDNAVLTAPIDPPIISQVYPDGTRLLQATNTLSFQVTSAAPIDASGVQVILNGVDVSGSLSMSGAGTTAITASYAGLQTNKIYSVVINITDTLNLSSLLNVDFDTYAPNLLWEAEDYDYDSGQFINSPILSSTPTAGSYFGVSGAEGIDFHDRNGNGAHTYRSSDAMAISGTGDTSRQNFVNAGVSDYNLGWFDGAGFPDGNNVGISSYQAEEWVNYTRTFAPGEYNLYARITSGSGPTATVRVAKVTSGQGTANQITTALGQFKFPALGWDAYAYVPLTDPFGNPVKVALTNTETLKVLAGSGANINFFMVVPATANSPAITSVYPDGSTLLQGTNQLTFTVSSATSTIAPANVVVTLNGVTNHSLTFSYSSSGWNVSVPLALDVTNYVATIFVADNAGQTHSTSVSFDTFNPASYRVEAEDWDFSSGQYIDNPVITSEPAVNSYFDKVGTDNVDSFVGVEFPPTAADYRYRSVDAFSTSVCYDTPTRALIAAQATNSLAFNYQIGWWSTNGWLNYTHTYPTGQCHIYARLASGAGDTYSIQLDRVSGSPATLGWFTATGRGYGRFDWVPLVNTNNGQRVTVTLNGLATLRTTTLYGGVDPNSYLIVPALPAPEQLQASFSGGVLTLSWSNAAFHLQSQTNSAATGLTPVWYDYPGGATSPVIVPVSQASGSVFFRLSN